MLAEVGGKAANLGELLRAGLPVPAGFCLTTAAYRQAMAPAGLEQVHRRLAATAVGDLPALAELAATARDRALAAVVPTAVADTITASYAALGPDVPVAVRSSATAEDLPSASFAGQQDTFLNVVGAEAVLDAVRRCWASLWTDRAVSYRATHGINPSAVALAVVVQRMVDAAVAGVLFTANPVTGRRHEAVIDAGPGLGEAVVSGAVNPDHFVVDGATGRILERRIGSKAVVIRPLPGGGTERNEQADGLSAPCLTDAQLAVLDLLGRRAEVHFGSPQDLEWAFDQDGVAWLTQSRAITTLYPLPEKPPDRDGLRVYLCFSLAQGLTRPLTPMGLAGFRRIASSVAQAAHFHVPDPLAGPPPYVQAGQRIFFDLTPAARSATGRAIVPRVFDLMEARSAAVLRRLFEDPRFSVTIRSPLPVLRHVVPVIVRFRVPESLLRALFFPEAALRRVERFGEQFRAALAVPADANPGQRLDHVERILGRELFRIVPSIVPLPALGFALLAAAGKLLGRRAEPGELQAVLRGLPNNVTTEMDLALWHLAAAIRANPESVIALGVTDVAELARRYRDGELDATVQSGLAGFLGRYGHRAVAEIDLGMPRWSDDPSHILGVLANYLRLEDPGLAPDRQFSKAAREAEEQVDRLTAAAAQRSRLRGALVRAALKRTRLLAGMRELPKFHIVQALAAVREQLALVGAELVTLGCIGARDDVFFLDLAEARAGLGGRPLHGIVERRRQAYEEELARRHIPRVLLSDGTEPEALPTAEAAAGATAGRVKAPGLLSGTPASAGLVTAPARVILDPHGARLEPGEILVAPSTDPGWTPLFLTAGGLVMEMGGPNSHGAVVAREYGIPAVVGVADATSRITTGHRITVDGAAGTVALASADS